MSEKHEIGMCAVCGKKIYGVNSRVTINDNIVCINGDCIDKIFKNIREKIGGKLKELRDE